MRPAQEFQGNSRPAGQAGGEPGDDEDEDDEEEGDEDEAGDGQEYEEDEEDDDDDDEEEVRHALILITANGDAGRTWASPWLRDRAACACMRCCSRLHLLF